MRVRRRSSGCLEPDHAEQAQDRVDGSHDHRNETDNLEQSVNHTIVLRTPRSSEEKPDVLRTSQGRRQAPTTAKKGRLSDPVGRKQLVPIGRGGLKGDMCGAMA